MNAAYLTTAPMTGYAVGQELNTPSTADTAPDRLAVFLRLHRVRQPAYAGSAANTRGVRPEYARRLLTVFSSRHLSFDGCQSLNRINR